MGQTYTNQIVKGAGFHYAGNQPLDDRLVVDTYDDLATLDANYSSYEGMPVYVKSVSDFFTKTASGWVIASGGEDNDIPIVSLRFPSYTDTQIYTNLYQRTFVFVRAETEFFGQTIRAVINGQSFTVTFPKGSQAESVQLSGDLSRAYLKTSKYLTSNGTFYELKLVQESSSPFDATTLVISTVKVYAPTVQASNVSLPVQDYITDHYEIRLDGIDDRLDTIDARLKRVTFSVTTNQWGVSRAISNERLCLRGSLYLSSSDEYIDISIRIPTVVNAKASSSLFFGVRVYEGMPALCQMCITTTATADGLVSISPSILTMNSSLNEKETDYSQYTFTGYLTAE